MEDIFNESDESSSDSESKQQDDLDDEKSCSQDRLMTLETEESSQERLHDLDGSSDTEGDIEILYHTLVVKFVFGIKIFYKCLQMILQDPIKDQEGHHQTQRMTDHLMMMIAHGT